MDLDAVRKIIEALGPACQKQGVRRIKVEDVEIEFADPYRELRKADIQKLAEAMDKNLPTDEEMLFWSAPGLPVKAPEEAQ